MPFLTKITGSTSENASYAVYTALFYKNIVCKIMKSFRIFKNILSFGLKKIKKNIISYDFRNYL